MMNTALTAMLLHGMILCTIKELLYGRGVYSVRNAICHKAGSVCGIMLANRRFFYVQKNNERNEELCQ